MLGLMLCPVARQFLESRQYYPAKINTLQQDIHIVLHKSVPMEVSKLRHTPSVYAKLS